MNKTCKPPSMAPQVACAKARRSQPAFTHRLSLKKFTSLKEFTCCKKITNFKKFTQRQQPVCHVVSHA